jgi:hypothetical protein
LRRYFAFAGLAPPAELKEYRADFDYRDSLRDSEWIQNLAKRVVADHQKLIARGRIRSFKEEWENANAMPAQVA